jgi:hypothetical protein
VRAGARSETLGSRRRGVLRVLEGRTGELATGLEVPASAARSGPWGYEASTVRVSAESGFLVTPRLLDGGRRVRLALEPFEARLAGATVEGLVVARSGASTAIELAPGETVVFGRLEEVLDARGVDPLAGAARLRGGAERLLLVRVELD